MKSTVFKPLTASIALLSLSSCFLLEPIDKSKFSNIEGHVFSLTTAGPINEAEITIVDPKTTEKTDTNGTFSIRGVPVNWVTLEIKAPGYETITRKFKVEPYGSKYVDFYLMNQQKTQTLKQNILFEREGDIWATDEYGYKQINLTEKVRGNSFTPESTATLSFSSPAWIENKSKIAYVVHDNSTNPYTKNGVWVMNPSGKMTQRITYIESRANDLAISNDAKSFIFSMINPDNAENIGLYKFNMSNNSMTSLSSNLLARDFTPKWSPKTNQIAFTSGVSDRSIVSNYDLAKDAQRAQIFIMNSDGFNRKQLTYTGDNTDPAWSPDGEKLAFVSNRTGKSEIWLMNKDGSGQRRLTSTEATRAGNPMWSSDGQRIIFNTNYKQKYNTLNASEIWVYEPDTYQMRMITNDALKASW